MTYALFNSTIWLHLDSSSRTLSGTPGFEDVGPVTVNLVASDDTGSASMLVTLVVSADSGPGLGIPLDNQFSGHEASSNSNSLILSHSSSMSLSFLPDTFTNINDNTVYYAICANNTPLPSWLAFNPTKLSFSGTTPESTSPAELSQTFGIKLIASDVVGFAGAVTTFQLIIESHVFAFDKDLYTFNFISGKSFNYTGLQRDLLLDGTPIKPSDLAQITAQTPSWMVFDTKTLALSGTVPIYTSPRNITVSATNIFGDKADTVILIQAAGNASNFFNGAIDTLNATIGSDFRYDLTGILNISPEVLVTVDLGNASSWLKFESSKLELTGHVSNETKPQQMFINITAQQGFQSQSKAITLEIVEGGSTSNQADSPNQSTTFIGTPSTTSPPRSPTGASANGEKTRRQKEAVIIAVPIVLVLLGISILILRLRRRRRQRLDKGYLNPSKEKISYPMQTPEHLDVATEEGVMKMERVAYKRTSLLPRMDWRRSRLHSPRTTENERTDLPKPSSWQEEVVRAIPEFSLLPEERPSPQGDSRRYSPSIVRSRNSRVSSVNYDSPVRRLSKAMNRHSISRASSLLVPARRVSGVGHGHGALNHGTSILSYSAVGVGHGIGGPPGYGRVMQSIRNPSILSGSSWATTNTSAIFHNGPSSYHLRSEPSQTTSTLASFPNPSTMNSLDLLGRANTIHETDDDRPRRHSGRTFAYPSRVHSRALSPRGAFLKRRARERQTQNPLFSAGPSCRAPSRMQRQSTLATQHSYSSSGSPSKASPSHRFNNHSFSTRVIDTLGRVSHFQSRSSFGSSNRYQSAESEAPSEGFYDEGEELREELDEEGNKQWRHMNYPNPLATHRSDSDSSPNACSNIQNDDEVAREKSSSGAAANLAVESLFSTGEERGSTAMQLNYLRAQAEGGRAAGGGQERKMVMGSKQMRPVSVDAHVQLKRGEANASMRGDVAFL